MARRFSLTTRKEWNKIDLTYQERFIEVKTTGLLQRWEKAKNPSNRFDISKKYPYEWGLPDADYSGGKIRAAHVYVFCVFDPQDEDGEITDVNQWHFFVFPRTSIESLWEGQDSVSLNVVKQTGIKIGFDEIKRGVDKALEAFN